ncbi:MAG: helix-turn-helix transcriptional regulator [Bacteriovoracaceae bacterium]|nr:helix-turn-helix transcriptional regulator [Bacteriovoracaceae bacterium]
MGQIDQMTKESSTYQEMTHTLRSILRQKSIKLSDIANELNISVATVKRIFSQKDGPLGKIEAICKMIDISFRDLVELSTKQLKKCDRLTKRQEKFLIQNDLLTTIFMDLFVRKMTLENISDKYQISRNKLLSHIYKLEKEKLIEVHPNDEIKFNIEEPLAFSAETAKTLAMKLIMKLNKILKEDIHSGSIAGREVLIHPSSLEEFKKTILTALEKLDFSSQRDYKIYDRDSLIEVYLSLMTISN